MGDRFKIAGLYIPHVIPITSILSPSSLAAQLCFACSRHNAKSSLSESVTFAPSFAATIPGRAVPHPS